MLREVTYNLHNSFEFFLDDCYISVCENFKQCCVFIASIEIVKSIQICSQMPYDNPTSARLLQDAQQKLYGMHIGCLTNIDHVLIFNQSTKDFEESRNVA